MKRLFSLWVAGSLIFLPALGCNREATTKSTKTVETPEGKTKVTEEKKVEKSGDHPPPVNP